MMKIAIAVLCLAAAATAAPAMKSIPGLAALKPCFEAVRDAAESSGALKTDLKNLMFSDDLDGIVDRITEEVNKLCTEEGVAAYNDFLERNARTLEIVKGMWVDIKAKLTEEEITQVESWVDDENEEALHNFFKPLFIESFAGLSKEDRNTLKKTFGEIYQMFVADSAEVATRFWKDCIDSKTERVQLMKLAKDEEKLNAFLREKSAECGFTEKETKHILKIAKMMRKMKGGKKHRRG